MIADGFANTATKQDIANMATKDDIKDLKQILLVLTHVLV